MVEHDHLVEQHEVDVAEVARLLEALCPSLRAKRRLSVLDVVVGEIPHKPSRERRHAFYLGRFIACEHLANGRAGMRHLALLHNRTFAVVALANAQQPVLAGDLHGRAKTQKRVAALPPVLFGAFEQKAVAARRAHRAHDLDRREPVGDKLLRHGNAPVFPRFGARSDFSKRRKHGTPPLLRDRHIAGPEAGHEKSSSSANGYCQGRAFALPAVPPCFTACAVRFCETPSRFRQLTYALTSRSTGEPRFRLPFTAPSVVHLAACFRPDSQHRGLSVRALLL